MKKWFLYLYQQRYLKFMVSLSSSNYCHFGDFYYQQYKSLGHWHIFDIDEEDTLIFLTFQSFKNKGDWSLELEYLKSPSKCPLNNCLVMNLFSFVRWDFNKSEEGVTYYFNIKFASLLLSLILLDSNFRRVEKLLDSNLK